MGRKRWSGRSQKQHEIKPFTRWGGEESEAGHAMGPGQPVTVASKQPIRGQRPVALGSVFKTT